MLRIACIVILGFGLIGSTFSPLSGATAQVEIAPCGYIDGFDFPVPGIDVTHTDFGVYRARFGGLHTGIDVAFGQLGAPVRAVARGRVTYSNIEGWDTEKGVVVIQHTLPDGSLVNSLYGHMEELNGYSFPPMDACVERGDIVGAVGAPSLSRPHLHYEIRTRYRHEGGPGYTQVNPMELGWLHPVDFTYLARLWVLPAYRGHLTMTEAASLPPHPLADGNLVVAHSATLQGLSPGGQRLWQFDTLGSVTGLLALPDGRVLASTSSDQVLVLSNGSYNALWPMPKPFITPPLLLGNAVVAMTANYTLAAFTPEGTFLWETDPMPGRAARWAINSDQMAVGTTNGALWVVDATGSVLYNQTYAGPVMPFAAPDAGFLLMTGSSVYHLDTTGTETLIVDTGHTFTSNAGLLRDVAGTLYVYSGEGRSLYAYDTAGKLAWIAYMPGSHLRAPLLGIGGGTLLYALTTDGLLLAFSTQDGRLEAQAALYNGGSDGASSTRWLDVQPDDTVRFSGGFLSIVTLNGTDLVADSP
jgi:outer membrane protein assembly factor BamB